MLHINCYIHSQHNAETYCRTPHLHRDIVHRLFLEIVETMGQKHLLQNLNH